MNQIELRIEQIDKEMLELYQTIEALDDNPDDSFEEYEERRMPYYKKIDKLDREKRTIMVPVFERDLPEYGDLMTLENFVATVRSGGFIDYDGYGYYVRGDKMSNIKVIPSDLKHNAIRPDFDMVMWFNK